MAHGSGRCLKPPGPGPFSKLVTLRESRDTWESRCVMGHPYWAVHRDCSKKCPPGSRDSALDPKPSSLTHRLDLKRAPMQLIWGML